MAEIRPHVILLGGPNGAGKSTSAPSLLPGLLQVTEFVNADVIAQGLSAFHPEGVALQAGRIMLERIEELAEAKANFAFETTLASRTFAPRLQALRKAGYIVHLVFLWLPSADMAIARVADRARAGGHSVPEKTIRRRYEAGLRNFFTLYRPLADYWYVYDNSSIAAARLIARGKIDSETLILDHPMWELISHE
jgi:predicted ABC-type ATPase